MRILVVALALTGCVVPDKQAGSHDCDECGYIEPTLEEPGGDADAPVGVDDQGTPLDQVPATLEASGLYADGVREFAPRWALYSDGAEKRRWIALPPGTQIDTSDPDYWRFPIGTKLWKDFTRDGILVETRYMAKYGSADNAWLFVPYQWSPDGTTAVPAIDGATNVNGTQHDIPPQAKCNGCHANVKSRVLGFSTFQLDYAAAAGLVDLDDATALGWLSTPVPRNPVPGTAQQRAVLGYFHANCGHCHNSKSPLINRPMFRLETDHIATVGSTRTYQSTVNVAGTSFGGATIVAKPGDPDHSIIITRMRSTDTKHRMPALGTETIDPVGMALIRAWITNL